MSCNIRALSEVQKLSERFIELLFPFSLYHYSQKDMYLLYSHVRE
jgi:hypothetical protein